ncbi:MAG: polyprenol monophosphomannose synthase [Deltaproteobacteria bacterium]|nr:polyprenol monophosphomannose synthase [Deltaproteobacteria bacterium]
MTVPHPPAVICLPTYNERDNLPLLVAEVRATVPEVAILIIDDNSPDGTGALADELAAADPRVHVLHRPAKQGLGRAYLDGFRWALQRNYELVFEMDCDFSHPPRFLPQFLEKARTCDLVLGSRYIAGGGTEDWDWRRRLISRGGNTYARMILGLPYRDLTGGFKCFHRRVLEGLPLDEIVSNGYVFQIELTWRAVLAGFSIGEVPIRFPDRTRGQSKMSGGIVREAVVNVWKLRIDKARLRAAAAARRTDRPK